MLSLLSPHPACPPTSMKPLAGVFADCEVRAYKPGGAKANRVRLRHLTLRQGQMWQGQMGQPDVCFSFPFQFCSSAAAQALWSEVLRHPLPFIYNLGYTIWKGKLVNEMSFGFEVKFGLRSQFNNLAEVDNFLENTLNLTQEAIKICMSQNFILFSVYLEYFIIHFRKSMSIMLNKYLIPFL